MNHTKFPFHTFHRSGATLAYNLDINIEGIKRHGTWHSDSVNTYIVADPQRAVGVSNNFQQFFDKSTSQKSYNVTFLFKNI